VADWSEELIERLRELWARGLSASQIADQLGGISRNAVIGKAHRLKLPSRPSPVGGEVGKRAAEESSKAPPARAVAAREPKSTAPAPEVIAQPAAKAPDPSPPVLVSVGPGGFIRQGKSEQQPVILAAPPRRIVPAKPGPEISGKTTLLDLNDKICRWPEGHPGEPDFHFCGRDANPGFPYCVEHCGRAYQAQLPRGERRAPPPLPFGGPRVR
jgi:GcrA cell cycle regulator